MEVLVLGPTVVRVGDRVVRIERRLERALLVRLASMGGAAVPDAVLHADLWADGESERAVQRLRVVVCRLRTALGTHGSLLTRTHAGYRIEARIPDLQQARAGADRVRAAARDADHGTVRSVAGAALALWRGPALGDLRSLPQGLAEAERLDELHLELAVARLSAEVELGASGELLIELGAMAVRHPLHERIHSLLAVALYRSARQAEALNQLTRLRRALAEGLGVDPTPDTADLELRLLRQDPALLVRPNLAASKPAVAAESHSGRSASPPRFVGRDGELTGLLVALARPGVVTLVGTPGIGKSRLAAEASRLVAATGRETVLVGLSQARCGDAVVDAVAAAIGVADTTDAVHACARRLGGALLVLDDAEPVIEAATTLVAALRRAVPDLTVLITSQRPLLLAEEIRHPLQPLDPDAAATLFLELAAADALVSHGRLEQDIATICSAIDWLPRGIELAAGLTRTLTVAQLVQRVPDSLRLLVGGRRDSDSRHRSLRAALDCSFGLLAERERAVLRRLAVITGTFPLETAECVVPDGKVDVGDVAPALADLVDRSLVTVHHGHGTRRFELLATVRQYALVELTNAGEEDATAARYTTLRAAAEPAVAAVGPGVGGQDRAVPAGSRRVTVAPSALRPAIGPLIQRGDRLGERGSQVRQLVLPHLGLRDQPGRFELAQPLVQHRRRHAGAPHEHGAGTDRTLPQLPQQSQRPTPPEQVESGHDRPSGSGAPHRMARPRCDGRRHDLPPQDVVFRQPQR